MLTHEVQKAIRARMKAMKISERELALRMGVDRTTTWAYFQPDTNLTMRTLNRIARALECEAKVLLRPLKGGV